MAGHRKADGDGGSEGPRGAVPPGDRRRDRRHGGKAEVRQVDPSRDPRHDPPGSPNTDGAIREGAAPLEIPVDPSRAVNLFMPETNGDLGIYKRMIRRGAIRPFEMPDGIERLADRVMEMMHMAQESGRLRDAMKAAEILRMLAADNREIALQLDKIDRLDAGKPTQISGQVSTEAQDRIKRIVSTQRSMANTEGKHAGSEDGSGAARGASFGRLGEAAEAVGGVAPARGDHEAPQDRGVERAPGEPGAGSQ